MSGQAVSLCSDRATALGAIEHAGGAVIRTVTHLKDGWQWRPASTPGQLREGCGMTARIEGCHKGAMLVLTWHTLWPTYIYPSRYTLQDSPNTVPKFPIMLMLRREHKVRHGELSVKRNIGGSPTSSQVQRMQCLCSAAMPHMPKMKPPLLNMVTAKGGQRWAAAVGQCRAAGHISVVACGVNIGLSIHACTPPMVVNSL